MADKKNRQQYKNTVKQLFGNDLTQEIRQLIDLAVRRQLTTQDVVERLVNTHYFRRQFPGLIEKGGTIANALTGEQGVGVSVSSLAGAIKNYRTALNQNQQIAQKYGYKNFNKDQFAKLIQDQTSPDEFGQRLAAVHIVDSNPALKAAFEAQERARGIKVTPNSAYKEALKAGDNRFLGLYEGAQFQSQLGFSKEDAASLSKGVLPPTATFDDVNQLVSEVRSNLQGYLPELQQQGINAAQLVKILGNPGAYTSDIEKIKNIAQQRSSLYGRPVQGTYAQQGAGGGLSQYPQQGEAAYG